MPLPALRAVATTATAATMSTCRTAAAAGQAAASAWAASMAPSAPPIGRSPLSYSSRKPASTTTAQRQRRAFPWPRLHVGTDICQIARIYSILQKPAASRDGAAATGGHAKAHDTSVASAGAVSTPAARFLRRLLTPTELCSTVAAVGESCISGTRTTTTATVPQILARLLSPGHNHGSTRSTTLDRNHRDPELWRAAVFLAGRFAAKEAAIKAHPHLALTLQLVRVVRQDAGPHADTNHNVTDSSNRKQSGPPLALVRVDDASDAEQEARLSISHDGEYATAVCLGFEA